ncbi:hypothetical protein [Limnoglobus roseus]|uniref:DUF4149 domain-containing protein n=1 Tax=Limnoglobus roseus TaxID=2598579 RepID=A0A5C1ALF3_9BACT|nr:hypothetical protein [Limnoglobus roseus]QEL19017.1 hypothetical protein PX52LOC_06070 [Limnoglobus roseus]
MNDREWAYLLRALPSQAGTLIVCLTAVVFAVFKMGRHPKPAGLTLAGAVMTIAATVVPTVFHAIAYTNPARGSKQHIEDLNLAGDVGRVAYQVKALGMALIVAAVFSGRQRQDRPRGYE